MVSSSDSFSFSCFLSDSSLSLSCIISDFSDDLSSLFPIGLSVFILLGSSSAVVSLSLSFPFFAHGLTVNKTIKTTTNIAINEIKIIKYFNFSFFGLSILLLLI